MPLGRTTPERVMRRGQPRSFGAALAFALVALVVVACGGAATPAPSFPPGAIVIHARNRAFDVTELQIPAGTEFSLAFVNEDGDMHNLAIRTKSGFDGDLLFRFDPVAAKTVVLPVGKIPKGSYFFLCEVHPNMWGTVFAY